MRQKREHLERVYDSLKNFTGDNDTYKYGDILFVSTRNNDNFDMVINADGAHNFLELYRMKMEEEYLSVAKAAELAGLAGQDIRVSSNDVANSFTTDKPYFRNVIISDAEVSQSIVVKATERATLDGVVIAGEKGAGNGKVVYAAKELALRNINAKDGSTLYNAFEGYQRMDDPEYKGIGLLIAENLNIDCPSLTHNIINVYTPADHAEIIIRNSKFNLTVDNTNVLRLSNYLNAKDVKVTFENCEWTYENGVTKNDWRWAGLALYQPAGADTALTGDMASVKTWKFTIRNCYYNGTKVTANNFGQHNQVAYFYNVGNTGAVTDPAEIDGLELKVL